MLPNFFRRRFPPLLRMALFLSLSTFLPESRPALAGSVMSIGNVTGPTAGEGTFEVLLSNPAGGQSVDVASFSFELMVPANSGVEFTGVSTSTLSAPYIFDGTGGSTVDPTFTLSLDAFPNTDFKGSDTEFTYPSISLAPGSVFGLALVSYSVSPSAPPGDVQITFVGDGTSLSDAEGKGIDFTKDITQGVIHIAGAAVPEPSSFVMAVVGVAAGLVVLRRTKTTPKAIQCISRGTSTSPSALKERDGCP